MIDTAGPNWRMFSYSIGGGGECMEVAELHGGSRLVRDSKEHGRGPILRFIEDVGEVFPPGL
jgi:hypothetical protein